MLTVRMIDGWLFVPLLTVSGGGQYVHLTIAYRNDFSNSPRTMAIMMAGGGKYPSV